MAIAAVATLAFSDWPPTWQSISPRTKPKIYCDLRRAGGCARDDGKHRGHSQQRSGCVATQPMRESRQAQESVNPTIRSRRRSRAPGSTVPTPRRTYYVGVTAGTGRAIVFHYRGQRPVLNAKCEFSRPPPGTNSNYLVLARICFALHRRQHQHQPAELWIGRRELPTPFNGRSFNSPRTPVAAGRQSGQVLQFVSVRRRFNAGGGRSDRETGRAGPSGLPGRSKSNSSIATGNLKRYFSLGFAGR